MQEKENKDKILGAYAIHTCMNICIVLYGFTNIVTVKYTSVEISALQ